MTSRDLTKWPRLLVAGEPVTEAQANEILIRTVVPAYLHSNDREWDEVVRRITRLTYDDSDGYKLVDKERLAWFKQQWAAQTARAEELDVVPLEYLHNNRITTTHVLGSYGWCDWDGTIGCGTFNVGKWPNHKDITTEWRDIAAAFPYLRLTAQLITNEGGYVIDGVEYPGLVAGQWTVRDGEMTAIYDVEELDQLPQLVPTGKDTTEHDPERTMEIAIANIVLGLGYQHVDPARLREAVQQVEHQAATRRRMGAGT